MFVDKRKEVAACLVWLLGWLLFVPSLVQAEQLPIKTYTTADGLAQDNINRIVRDFRGFLWFCTREGLSRFDGYDDDERIFEALCAGASGYLLKNTPPARLLESLKEAIAGGAPMSPEVARRVLNIFREIRPPEHADYHLAPHELRLLRLLVEGHSYKTAASQLGVSVKTISFHLQKIYEKLQVHSKSEAVAKALRSRLV